MSTHYRDLRRSEAPKVKEKLSETRLKLGTKYCVNSLVGRKGEGGEGLPVMKGGEEFLMALKSNERLSFSLTHSPLLFQFSSSRPLPPPRFLVFFNRRASCNDRPLLPTIHPSLLFTRLFHRKLHSREFLPIIVVRTNDRNTERMHVWNRCIFFFFIILDFSRIIFSFVRKRCVSFYFLKQSTLSIPREKSKESISDRSLLRYSYSMHRDGCVSRYHLKT